MPEEGVTGLEHMGFVKFNFRFIVHPPLTDSWDCTLQNPHLGCNLLQVSLGEYFYSGLQSKQHVFAELLRTTTNIESQSSRWISCTPVKKVQTPCVSPLTAKVLASWTQCSDLLWASKIGLWGNKQEGDTKSNTCAQGSCAHSEFCRPYPGKIFSPEALAPRYWLDPACLAVPVDFWWVCTLLLALSAH